MGKRRQENHSRWERGKAPTKYLLRRDSRERKRGKEEVFCKFSEMKKKRKECR